MKFDIIIGNPPYGKNSNLAIEFLNRSADLTDQIWYVLPRTFRKVSVWNRIHGNLHLAQDVTVPDHVFPGSIITCYQHWVRQDQIRPQVLKFDHHAHFEFVEPDQANVCVGRVGGGPCGQVFVNNFMHRSTNSHYFLKAVNDQVIQKLQQLSVEFRQVGEHTVGVPSLSKHELIEIYTRHTT